MPNIEIDFRSWLKAGFNVVFIVTALTAEATPIIQNFGLAKQAGKTPFALYKNDELTLVISGIGKLKSAMATTWLYSQVVGSPESSSCCLNVGIAGHPEAPLGDCFRANKIIDADDGKIYFPPQIAVAKVAGQTVKTVSKPDLDYDDNVLSDMEASGFYLAASKFVSGEQINILKIISDNKTSATDSLNAAMVEELIARNMLHINDSVQALSQLEVTSQEADLTNQLHQRYAKTLRLTVTQARQLSSLLDDCLSRDVAIDILEALKPATAKRLLQELKTLRDAAPLFGC